MYLDTAEEKMLRAIVQSAVASAAAGRPFAGEFRHYRISATRLQVNEEGIAEVEVRVVPAVAEWLALVPCRDDGHAFALAHALREAYSCEFNFIAGEIAHHEKLGRPD